MREKCSLKCTEYPENIQKIPTTPDKSPHRFANATHSPCTDFSESKSTFSLFWHYVGKLWDKWKSCRMHCHKIFNENFQQNGRNSRIFVLQLSWQLFARNKHKFAQFVPEYFGNVQNIVKFWRYCCAKWKRVKDWLNHKNEFFLGSLSILF